MERYVSMVLWTKAIRSWPYAFAGFPWARPVLFPVGVSGGSRFPVEVGSHVFGASYNSGALSLTVDALLMSGVLTHSLPVSNAFILEPGLLTKKTARNCVGVEAWTGHRSLSSLVAVTRGLSCGIKP